MQRSALLLALGVLACTSPAPSAHRTEEVLAADRFRARAMVDASVPRLGEALHEELTYAHSNGVVETRAELIEQLRSGRIDYRSIETSDPHVRIRGDTAIVSGPVRIVVAAGGRVLDLRSIYTAVYWYRDGRWRLAAYHSSALHEAEARGTEPPASARARGAGILLPFKRALKQALVQGLRAGPAAAIDACRVRAPEIAADLARDDVRVGRTSHRLRNPDNAPAAWLQPLLARYVGDPERREAELVTLPGDRAGYVEPIRTEAPCLTCHGSALAPAVTQALAEHYPDDRATGFELGELRGLFWATFPIDE